MPLSLPSTNTNEFYCWKEGPIYHGMYVDFDDGGAWQHVTSTSLTASCGGTQFMSFNAYEGGNMLKKSTGGYRFFSEQDAGYFWGDWNEALTACGPLTAVNSDVPMNNGKMISMPGATTFAAWAAANTPAAPGPLDTPQGDGISNLLKCALGLEPTQSDAASLPAATIVTSGATPFLRLQYYQHPQYSQLCTTLQSSPDLSTWSSIAPLSITLMSDGSELVEGRVPVTGNGQFLRVEATQH